MDTLTQDQIERLCAHAERGLKEHIKEAATLLANAQAGGGSYDFEDFDAVLEDARETQEVINELRNA